MGEATTRKYDGLRVGGTEPDSPAHRAGLLPGDRIVGVNGHTVRDLIDFRFQTAEQRSTLTVRRNDETLALQIRRRENEEIGLSFEFELADEIHTCNNKCVFCFIHQMPKGMRRSLYLMDDDYRLSFLHGHYVTLTNMSEEEFDRLIEQRLSPIYVSVHATDPAMRAVMLGRAGADPILPRLRALAEGGVDAHCQIVLCPGMNDGAVLDRTLSDLAALHPESTGLACGALSVAIVPVGLTQFRQRLYPVTPITPEYASAFLDELEPYWKRFRRELGCRFAYPADEWFYYAARSIPGRVFYDDFPQLEDGVGTTRLFLDELASLKKRLPPTIDFPFQATLATSSLAASPVRRLADALNQVKGIDLNVLVVPNRFFGGNVCIAGLMTGQDIAASSNGLDAQRPLVIPSICLREEKLFLDDWDIARLEQATGRKVLISEPSPRGLWSIILKSEL